MSWGKICPLRIYNQHNDIQIKIMRIILLLLTCCLITSCTQTRTPSIEVTYGERQSLYFTGRGSAAGIMMDSVLGGAGIAIGIAIDEGIAKDISVAILASNPDFSMKVLIEEALRARKLVAGLRSVVIDKYGFQAAPDDNVIPLMQLKFICISGSSHKVSFVTNENVTAIPFEQSKTNGRLVEKLLRDAVAELLGMYSSCERDV